MRDCSQVFDGHAYGLPWYVDAHLLFYRQDRLAEAGFSAPPRTLAEWVTAMKRIKAQAGPGTDRSNGHAMFLPMDEWEPPLALGLGASLLKDQDRYGNFRGARFRRALEGSETAPQGGTALTPIAAGPIRIEG